MPRYAAFLRGMNLGNRRIKNPDLVVCFEELGCENVEAFLASGNVVFDARGSRATLAKKIEKGLQQRLGYEVPTFVRSARELLEVAKATPFAARKGRPPAGKLQVAFLRESPHRGAEKALANFESKSEWLALGAEEIYWWPNAGVSDSELDWTAISKVIGPLTIRTHRTVDRMAVKFFS